MILEREQNFRQYQREEGSDAVAMNQGGQQYRSSGGTGPDPGCEQGLFMD